MTRLLNESEGNAVVRLTYVLLLLLMNITTELKAEIYTIDAASSYKEIRPGGYNMGTSVNSKGQAIEANNYFLLKGGKPWFPVMGEIH